jgi:hypothetical protein
MAPGIVDSATRENRARPLRPARRGCLGGAAILVLLAAASAVRSDAPRLVAISLVDGKASGSALTTSASRAPALLLRQGERVELRWSSDRSMALHLHGYDRETRAAPGLDGVMSFVARAAGRFPVETHDAQGRHRAVVYIEVHPP